MLISAVVSGGFSGLPQHYNIDTRRHPAGPALEAAVAACAFFTAPAPSAPIGADLAQWDLTITADHQQRQRHIVENGGPPWQDLLDLIRSAA
jgi:hypothetical protein